MKIASPHSIAGQHFVKFGLSKSAPLTPAQSHQHAAYLASQINHAITRHIQHYRKSPHRSTLICSHCAISIGHSYNGSHSTIGLAQAFLTHYPFKTPCHICHKKFRTIYKLPASQPFQFRIPTELPPNVNHG